MLTRWQFFPAQVKNEFRLPPSSTLLCLQSKLVEGWFYHAEYLTFLSKVTPSNQREYKDQVTRFNLGVAGEADCPVFDGMFEYCQVGHSIVCLPSQPREQSCLSPQ